MRGRPVRGRPMWGRPCGVGPRGVDTARGRNSGGKAHGAPHARIHDRLERQLAVALDSEARDRVGTAGVVAAIAHLLLGMVIPHGTVSLISLEGTQGYSRGLRASLGARTNRAEPADVSTISAAFEKPPNDGGSVPTCSRTVRVLCEYRVLCGYRIASTGYYAGTA